LWLAEEPATTGRRMVALFGTIAVLEPLGLAVCEVGRGQWLGVNRPADPERIVWVPPSVVRAPLSWDGLATARQVERLVPGIATERRRAYGRLTAYLEELSALREAGAPGPERPWCEVPARERRQVLAEHGVTPRWSRR
jgi:hypothetical protein